MTRSIDVDRRTAGRSHARPGPRSNLPRGVESNHLCLVVRPGEDGRTTILGPPLIPASHSCRKPPFSRRTVADVAAFPTREQRKPPSSPVLTLRPVRTPPPNQYMPLVQQKHMIPQQKAKDTGRGYRPPQKQQVQQTVRQRPPISDEGVPSDSRGKSRGPDWATPSLPPWAKRSEDRKKQASREAHQTV